MNLISHIVERKLELPPPATRDLIVQRDLRVPMPDGVELLADRWAPRHGGEGLPTALLRSPYGRAGFFGAYVVRPLARPVSLRPGRPDARSRRHQHHQRWSRRQHRPRGVVGCAHVHESRARRGCRGDRRGQCRDLVPIESRQRRRLRPTLRRRPRRPLLQCLRRPDQRVRRRRALPSRCPALADRVPPHARTSDEDPGLQRGIPAVCPQSRHRRTARERDDAPGRRPNGLP